MVHGIEDIEEDLLRIVSTLYPADDNTWKDPFDTNEYLTRNRTCQQVLSNQGIMQSWQHCKDELDKIFHKYSKTTYDIELLSDVPSLRYGIEVLNTNECHVWFSFYISVVKPFYGWYFIDREKFPKGPDVDGRKLGPPVSKFIEMNMLSEYEMLNSGKLTSPLDVSLTGWELINFLTSTPRFVSNNTQEQVIVASTEEVMLKYFPKLTPLPISLAQKEVTTIARKGHMGGSRYNLFECLFLADFSYC